MVPKALSLIVLILFLSVPLRSTTGAASSASSGQEQFASPQVGAPLETATPTPTPTAGPNARPGTDLPPRHKPKKKRPKLTSRLADRVEAERLRADAQGGQRPRVQAFVDPPDAVHVVIEAERRQANFVAQLVGSLGGAVEATADDLVQARIPVSALEDLVQSTAVRFVREPHRFFSDGHPSGQVGQGVASSGASAWQAVGVKGAGVKIAITDLGFDRLELLLGTELPAQVTTSNFCVGGSLDGIGTWHGTAVAEIVHDMAPDAQLSLISFCTEVELLNAIDYAIDQGVQVISNSTGCFLCGPGDGTGPINSRVTEAVEAGIFYAQSAGNYAGRHWSGSWTDTDADGTMNFTPVDELLSFLANIGQVITLEMKWDDPFTASCNDYDLYLYSELYSPATVEVASSEGTQACSEEPTEALDYLVLVTGTYGAAIRHSCPPVPASCGAPPSARFHLMSSHPLGEYGEAAGSLAIPADNSGAMTAGAMNWSTPSAIESFSSRGPTTDGRTKPDIAAPDEVSSVAKNGTFGGTSASAPHVAGAAALVKQVFPNYSPSQIRSFFEGRASDLGDPGKDNTFGAGRLRLGAALPPLRGAGDANGDCRVDIVDFSVLIRNFGRQATDQDYDARADLNGDNQVDIQDFSVLATGFGMRCPD